MTETIRRLTMTVPELREELEPLRAEIAEMRAQITEMHADIATASGLAEVRRRRAEIGLPPGAATSAEIEVLHQAVNTVAAENSALAVRVAYLEGVVQNLRRRSTA